MKKVMVVFGTRPEAIKMCPVVLALKERKLQVIVCITGQHKDILHEVLTVFEIAPDYNLAIMREKQSLFDITTGVLVGISEILSKENPDVVMVHGDTTTAFSTALACYYKKISVAHIEAGLRTNNIYSPFPEEFNRQAISLIARYNFAPTKYAAQNLINEGKKKESIFITGNTVIDALKTTVKSNFYHPEMDWIADKRLILMTAHRRENIGAPMEEMFSAIRKIAEEYEDIRIIYPIHPNPLVREIAFKKLKGCFNIHLIEPLDVISFHNFMAKSFFIITDSGGIQEEAPSLAKPVLVMRDTTERPEGIEAGTLRLVGTKMSDIYSACKSLLDNDELYRKMARAKNPYGDGSASKKIADIIYKELNKKLS